MNILLINDDPAFEEHIQSVLLPIYSAESNTSFDACLELLLGQAVEMIIVNSDITRNKALSSELTNSMFLYKNIWVPTVYIGNTSSDYMNDEVVEEHCDVFILYPAHPLKINLVVSTLQNIAHSQKTLRKVQQELITKNKKLSRLSHFDELTALPNRRYFNETLEQEMACSRETGKKKILALGDIDFFKPYNDTYGHVKGDKCLHKVAQCINDVLKKHNFDNACFRYGGEEFVLVLSNTSTAGSLIVGERIRSSIESLETNYTDQTLKVTVSVGVSSLLNDDNMSRLFQRADKALYKSKHLGRNRVVSAGSLQLEPMDLVIC